MGKTSLIGERKRIRKIFAPALARRFASTLQVRNILSVLSSGSLLRKISAYVSSPAKTNSRFLRAKNLSRKIEAGLVFPIGLADPLQLLFVCRDRRVIDQFVVEQIGVDATRDTGGIPLVLARLANRHPVSTAMLTRRMLLSLQVWFEIEQSRPSA